MKKAAIVQRRTLKDFQKALKNIAQDHQKLLKSLAACK